MSVVAIIPARYGSTRLPGKPLADIGGKPMIQHVYESASKAPGLARVLVATDDRRIERAVKSFGGEVVMTSRRHTSGTDRLAEVARKIQARMAGQRARRFAVHSRRDDRARGGADAAQSRRADGHGVHADLLTPRSGTIPIS